MHTTSPTLLDQLRRPGERAAWDRFVRLYTPLLVRWAARRGFGPADADDIVQEVFARLVRELPRYARGPGQSFRGWLARLLTNVGHNFRRDRATRALPGADGLSGVGDEPPAAAVEELDEAEYRRLLLRRGLDLVRPDFSDATWAAFTGVMIDGRPAAEVAAAVGITENAVYLARHRVLTRLRQELAGLLD
jgi:RNA polymerase sigma-70 factor (ECF subfamily)